MGNFEVQEIPFGSQGYRRVLEARDRILRRPLGLTLSPKDTRGEENERHFVLQRKAELLGGVIARIEASNEVRLRQMWIESDHAMKGWGRMLILEVLSQLRREGFHRFVLHARQNVQGFYQKCGFISVGPTFEEVGLPHQIMICEDGPK